jgi:hypothetical protein
LRRPFALLNSMIFYLQQQLGLVSLQTTALRTQVLNSLWPFKPLHFLCS